MAVRTIEWRNGSVVMIDQRLLPTREVYRVYRDHREVAKAIKDMVIRGAPAIGVAAAMGIALGMRTARGKNLPARFERLCETFAATRPTAVNLFWAIDRMRRVYAGVKGKSASDVCARLAAEAVAVHDEDIAANRRMGAHGATLIPAGATVLTHCNAGALATAGFGTALGVIRAGAANGKITQVYAGETRPWLQGARLTIWELLQDKIPARLIADSAASHLMKSGEVQWVIVGADRIAANGDTANKIGTYQLAISARHHGVKFMVVAPSSTVDMATPDGAHIHIELRDAGELFGVGGQRTVADGAQAWNPVFDVTPAELIDALVTERGVIERPDAQRMRAMFA